MAAMAAFTFSSCEDVPEPYTQPTKPDAPSAGEPKGTGTAADPFNIAGIIKYIENGGSADQEVYTKGKVVSVKAGSFDATYGSLKYYISDDGTTANQFYVYNGYAGPNRTKFSGEDALKPGDEVVICGKAKNYSGTNEYDTGNYLVSLNGKPTSGSTTPDTPATKDGITIDGTTVTLSNAAATTTGASVELDLNAAGLVNQAAVETVKFSDGSTVTFDANGQENGPKFYTNTKGVRVYANNKLIFKGIKKIKQIVMTCDSYNGTNHVGNATATIEFSGTTATYTNLFTETTGGGVQLRVKTIKIVYAE